jgi:hypothetical protein
MDRQAIIRRAVEIGEQHGFITFELLPPSAHRLEPEAIEALLDASGAQGTIVTETSSSLGFPDRGMC